MIIRFTSVNLKEIEKTRKCPSHTEIFSKRRKIYALWVKNSRLVIIRIPGRPLSHNDISILIFCEHNKTKIFFFWLSDCTTDKNNNTNIRFCFINSNIFSVLRKDWRILLFYHESTMAPSNIVIWKMFNFTIPFQRNVTFNRSFFNFSSIFQKLRNL